jgi:RNA polymerase sigma-70 factor (ECF subfamily)
MNGVPHEFLPTRESLLSRLRHIDDHASWQEFYDLYYRLIFSFAVRKGLTEPEAQDVVQETLLAVAKSMPTFCYEPDRCSFKSWLRHLAEARIADHFRRRKRGGAAHVVPTTETEFFALVATTPDQSVLPPDEVWEREWQQQLMTTAMERVRAQANPRQFRIFHALVVQGLAGAEVARMFDTNLAVVYVARHRVAGQIKKEVRRLEADLATRGALG